MKVVNREKYSLMMCKKKVLKKSLIVFTIRLFYMLFLLYTIVSTKERAYILVVSLEYEYYEYDFYKCSIFDVEKC
ncbi:cell division protein FtsK [Bacillus sp. AFS054943]|uniref:Cell division protein FtsK n=1 Tax=Bacillus cereus TaxID=1396 RepID=A0A2A8IVB0_BACCE|nr:cell division protein FtsK [Bacillus cereus]PFA65271.1 cell division protein FtsK [Bacillus sp. AFS015896]PGL87255.1 cell division protein FtsK [Bacillus sp. AFS054943]PGU05335.1 cell division protein FtsK [Bacillus cereus]PGZ69574.1 cell division protein FtsK [Bacillus sp. AFS029637]